MNLSKKTTNIIAAAFLLIMAGLSFGSMGDDSLTMDELAHLPAGYSYLTQQDMRLNPEHPPLIKDIAALPLLFIKNINFPSEIKPWQEDVNGQWDFGRYFLYQANNPAEKMVLWGRIPMVLILLLLGFFVFKWTRELFGNFASLLALFFFAFSPTLLAHGRLVTTDVGAAFGIFAATYFFIKALQSPSKKSIILAGLFFGLAELLKFSAILLLPLFIFLGFIWWLMKMGKFWPTLKILIFVFLIGFILIWPVYQYHVWHYPAEKQLSDSQIYLAGAVEPVKQTLLWMADKPVLRAYSLYFTGLTMASIRVVGGNTTYFLGEVSNIAWKNYFPIVYLMKVPLAFHLLTLLVLIYLLFSIRCGRNFIQRTKTWLTSHLPEFAMFTFICLYWLASITGNLNIGIRHLLPVFPFTILLVSGLTAKLLKEPYLKLKYLVLSILILWQACSVFSVYPYFLTYFNEAVGGPANGYKYVADSNLDWGQDLKRLNYWLEENKVDKIYLDYFGGGDPQSTLGNKYAPWWGERNPEEFLKGNYLAVSATFLQGGRGKPIVDIPQAVEYYLWLNNYQPLTTIGHSIFIYYID